MSDLETFARLNKKLYKDQAIWFLNAIWPTLKDARAEELWTIKNIFVEFDIDNHEEGCDLDEFQLHRVFEKLNEGQTVQQMRNTLRTAGVDNFKRIGMLHFLVWHFQQDWHKVANAPQGDNSEQLAKAQKMLDEVTKLFEESQKKAEESKKVAKEAAEKEKIAKESAAQAEERQKEVQKAEDEVTKALNDVKAKEQAKEDKKKALQHTIDTAGLVAKNRAINELAQLEKEDDLPLRQAKITLEAAKRKAEKATKAATEAKEKADADAENATKAKQAADVAAEQAEQAVEEMSKKVAEAEAYLKEQQEASSGSGQGAIWWLNRELEEKKKYMPMRKGGVAKK